MYRIRASETVSRIIHVEDGIQTEIPLLPILAPAAQAQQLAAELERRGFHKADDSDVWIREGADGIAIQIDTKTNGVTVSIVDEQTVAVTRHGEASTDEDFGEQGEERARTRAQESARRMAEKELDQTTAEHRAAATKRLESALGAFQAELDQITNRVTTESLKVRAAQIGEVQEISEDPTSGEMTIKVKV